VLKLPPEAVREHKDENEAHFVRMGIGRSLYAYRLAYGELPESLQALVESGIMDARYLHDENGYPIRAWRAGGFDALVPSSRRAAPRTAAQTLELAAGLKVEVPGRTAAQICQILRLSCSIRG